MQKGDIVMAEHPDSRAKRFIRFYGIVHEFTKTGGVLIRMADGTLIDRQFNSIAVYIQPPSNWQELFEQQIVFSPQKKHMMTRRSYPKQRHN